ncbi:MAG: dTDP-4-dehydrorhamnose reductase [Parcubacteria group bacterium Greene0416_79]|nr:MAG: dTDP-4-dehydrorhamnose reductase [Parcubacteria group bacterium Greene0416_79]
MTLDLNRVLVTGGRGMVGRYADFGLRPFREALDITDKTQALAFIRTAKPSAILHLAAETDMRYCEAHPKEALRVNAEATATLAKAAAVGARFVYLSTNAVFDGLKESPYDEDDIPYPVNAYGRSKYEGEEYVKAYAKEWLIVRTGWVFGGGRAGDKRFVGRIISQLKAPEIKAIADNFGAPTYAKDLMSTIKELILSGKTGTVHVANSGIASRFDQAKYITDFFAYHGKITPMYLRDLTGIPSSLKNEALVSKTLRLRSWQEALSEYLKTEWPHNV